MEKINIVELLKDCPTGMELDCTMFNEVVKFDGIDKDGSFYPIRVKIKNNTEWFDKYGCFSSRTYAKCVIFPKGKTTWEGFVPPYKFKDGDIVYIKAKGHNHNEFIIIFKEIKNDHIHKHACFAYQVLYTNPNAVCHLVDIEEIRIATEEEKEKLFDAIKANSYKWNAETKTLEKLIEPKFKVGDRIKSVMSSSYYTVVDIKNNNYFIKSETEKYPYQVSFENEINYKLAPDKFDINTLVPLESRVLVRNANNKVWRPTIFGCYMKDKYEPFYVLGGTGWKQCIPYEGNEHLLGKTDDCDEYYKTWK